MTTVVVVDDQALVRAGLRTILENAEGIEVLADGGDGLDAVRLCREFKPQVVVLDIRMPKLDGVEATRRITADPSVPSRVLILTTYERDEYLYEAIRAGASGFLLKSAPPHQLVSAVRSVAEGDALLAPAFTRRLMDEFASRPQPGTHLPPVLAGLTARELDVLRLIAAGLSNQEIAEQLFVGMATVKTHVNRLLSKLEVRDRIQAVVLAYETGLVRPGDGTGVTPSRS